MPDPIYALVGEAIRRRRDATGMTQASLAKHIGLSRTSITNIEAGKQPILIPQLYRAAAALNVRVPDLLPDPSALVRVPATKTPPEIQSLITRLSDSLPVADG